MQVDGTRTDVIAAWQGDACTTHPADERSEHRDGSPHLGDEGARGVPRWIVHSDYDGPIGSQVDLSAQACEHLSHDRHIGYVGNVADDGLASGEQGRRHELESGVLRPADVHLPLERVTPPDEEGVAKLCEGRGVVRHSKRIVRSAALARHPARAGKGAGLAMYP